MSITHRFTNSSVPSEGGTWFDDYGRKICDWTWDASTKTLIVKARLSGSRIDLSSHGEQNFTEEKLRVRLPDIALDAAERLRGTKLET